MKYIFFAAVLFLFSSCSKDDKTTQQTNAPKTQVEDIDDSPADTNMTPEEKFSTAILIDFLNDSSDEKLAEYLETEIYKMNSNYRGASVIEITPSTWLVMLEKDGVTKNYLVQKYVDFTTNEDYFKMKETKITPADVFTRGRTKTSAGE